MLNNTLHFKTVAPDLISAYTSRLHAEATKGDIGYYHLPKLGNAILDKAKALRNRRKNIRHIVVIGIGGSSLGAKAVSRMLKHEKNPDEANLHFLENLDPWSVEKLLQSISFKESFLHYLQVWLHH